MKKIHCQIISGIGCGFWLTGNNLDHIKVNFVQHYNDIHDPEFVGKCQDDLIIEYGELLDKVSLIFDGMVE